MKNPANMQERPTIILPFKPFTFDEVQQITGVAPTILDHWTRKELPVQRGDDQKSIGLNWMQTFAVFVGWRYLHEGADQDRANGVVELLGWMTEPVFREELAAGNTFCCPASTMRAGGMAVPPGSYGMLVPCPKMGMAQRLNLVTLYNEFQHHVNRVFPNG